MEKVTWTCQCGARYRFSTKAAGLKIRCRKCGRKSRLPDTGPLPFKEETPPSAPPIQFPSERDVIIEEAEPEGPVTRRTTFWGDILSGFIFFIEPTNLSALFVCWFATLITIGLLHAGSQPFAATGVVVVFVGFMFVGILSFGWLCSYYMRIVLEVAGDEDELPGTLSEGWWDATFRPLIVFVATWACLLCPAIVLIWLRNNMNLNVPILWIQAVLVLAVVMWPMAALCVSIGGVSVFARADLMLYSVARTILPYTVVWILLLITGVGAYYLVYLISAGVGGGRPLLSRHPLATVALLSLILTYSAIVAMRVIGLYYRHFKHRFAWSWE